MRFNKQASLQLDKAVVASESNDELRMRLGHNWRRKLEEQIFKAENILDELATATREAKKFTKELRGEYEN